MSLFLWFQKIKLNIEKNEVMTIGDNMNDKKMIEEAGLGVVMKGSTPVVTAVADFVTDDNNNQVSDIKNPDTMDTKASEKTYEKDNRKKEYSTEIKKVSRKLKKGFEAADMHVDIIV